MHERAEERVAELKERGFTNAGLYDPAGVGGTHVMYVLHHADKPGLYSGLPADPAISPTVSLWKGITKPLAMAGIAAAALGGLFHYVMKGPNDVSKEVEAEVDKELEGEK
ncbi:MAG: formate dehydrogenase subunit beta, partial [Proteobacteria bacterium]|nr:formate dehydrogenase subunit beta [Pseudomonadota bacterium]